MAKPSQYAKQLEDRRRVYQQAERDTEQQFMTDIVCIALNEAGWGEQRIRKLFARIGKLHDEFSNVRTVEVDSDVLRVHLDERLRSIFKSGDFQDFDERYEWLQKITYQPRR